ncbi:PAS domain-containing protein [Arenibaculum pallidiluteum]|uniref:PAS domain-containing protein n=1 Tax=Arenibaculum pallidiluteum TaxID=2812559 RepID=UPI001A961BD8|nr:PAS domain-containing protein [Arenibaculum pallidiluteum]
MEWDTASARALVAIDPRSIEALLREVKATCQEVDEGGEWDELRQAQLVTALRPYAGLLRDLASLAGDKRTTVADGFAGAERCNSVPALARGPAAYAPGCTTAPLPRSWWSTVVSLAGDLVGRAPDWRDITKGLEVIRSGSKGAPEEDMVNSLLDRFAGMVSQTVRHAEERILLATSEIQDACIGGVDPENCLRSALKALKRVVAFDVATYCEYAYEEGEKPDVYVKSQLAMDGDEEFRWPIRWMKMPKGVVHWLEGRDGSSCFASIDEFLAHTDAAEELLDNPLLNEYRRRQVESFLVIRRMRGDRVSSTLMLGRKHTSQAEPFGRVDQELLQQLGIERVMRRVAEKFDQRTAAIAEEIASLFSPDAVPLTVAKGVVELLGKRFGWEYVGLYRVNRASGYFEPVAEHDANGNLSQKEGYRQKLDAGMLGETLRQRRPIYIPVVHDVPETAYIRTSESQASALCFPVFVNQGAESTVEWILDLESAHIRAFPSIEQDLLASVVRGIERTLALWYEAQLNKALLAAVGQGVVVLGLDTKIVRANTAARRLLGIYQGEPLPLGEDDEFRNLKHYARDECTRVCLTGEEPPRPGTLLKLRGRDGVDRVAMVGRTCNDEALHRKVWLLSDPTETEWMGGLHYMETAVRAVAAQSRSRLLLAGALIRRVKDAARNGGADERLDRALQCISLAHLTYERIALEHDVMREPIRFQVGFDVADVLARTSASISDNECLNMAGVGDGVALAYGDPERFAFAVRSVFGFIFAVREPSTEISVSLCRRTNLFDVVFVAVVRPDLQAFEIPLARKSKDALDAVSRAERLALSIASLGLEAVESVIIAHGATLRTERNGPVVQVRFAGLEARRSSEK